jgi:phosphoribosylamine--glycine ligase
MPHPTKRVGVESEGQDPWSSRTVLAAKGFMRILVVGSGGREHALAWKLKQSPEIEQIFCAPGNAGTALIGENVAVTAGDLAALARFAKQNRIGLTVVGPDDPLAAGIADLFQGQGLRIFGPGKSAARLESSKIFAKTLMRTAGIPTATAEVFTYSEEALGHCETASYPLVIKADGLALGKGVIIAQDRAAARSAIDAMMNRARFGEAGRRVVIEQFLRGTECSLHALVDGSHYRLLATARDHKRAFDGDQGPNTGGMGAVSPANNWSATLEQQFDLQVMRPLLGALREHHVEFRGLLFPGLMITSEGARVLEFNCRFGDPETQAILPRLKSDLLPLLQATIDGNIADQQIVWDERPSVTIVLASGGYPDKYETGKPIMGLAEAAALEDVQIFHAGTRQTGNVIATSGGRVLAVTALGTTVEEARDQAYKAVSCIHFEGCHYRRDIAQSSIPA